MATILVIDDEVGIRGLLATLLEKKGHIVVLADGGKRGLELCSVKQPDVIILDLKMPDMDGKAVLRQLRAREVQTPVIVLTGVGNEALENEVRLLGAAALIHKEFSLHQLGDTLKQLLDPPDSSSL